MAKHHHRKTRTGSHRMKLRRHVQEPKTIHIDGHELTQAQHEDFERRYNERLRLQAQPGWTEQQNARRLALSDVLFNSRPSTKAGERCFDIGMHLSRVSLVIAGAKDFSLYQSDPELISRYNAVLGHAVDQVEAVAKELRQIHAAIAQEVAS